ncbi:MAG: malto-oligosyltrehalose trehalohydrolase [Nitrospinota bacterium]|nr:MAG: malto-oligosyltrehalose trehalohydrolase [Nitrospinota bacterium]
MLIKREALPKNGAWYRENHRCTFRVWAPLAPSVDLRLLTPEEHRIPMDRQERGYWEVVVEGIAPGTRYLYHVPGKGERPDPASHFQPDGVHAPSQVVDHTGFPWTDDRWRGPLLSELIIYELHVGTFTPEGTFEAILPRLPALQELGITALELMPVAQFPGERNWGYDGVYPFAVQNSYGGPAGLKRLVNACHNAGIAVILDVVYNHLGPEGNYLRDFGPYFTRRYQTPWGEAINFDGAYSDEVRAFFIENALYWLHHYHIDALRLDAVHAIHDQSALPFLQELAQQVNRWAQYEGRRVYLMAESDLNDPRLIRPPLVGGYGIHAQWCDDFHHALHALLTGEKQGYYQDFGRIAHLVKALREGFVYTGQYSAYRQRRHGHTAKDRPAEQLVVFAQNHDQIGNRMRGERLSRLVSFEGLKLAAGALLLSPFLPLLFMGEEYGEEAPFPYFVSHSDPALIEAVRQGRQEEFGAFAWQGIPPDPQSVETFLSAKLRWERQEQGKHRVLRDFYRTLIQLRREIPALAQRDKEALEAWGWEAPEVLFLRRWTEESQVFLLFNFHPTAATLPLPLPPGHWDKRLDSAESCWYGPGTDLPDRLTSGETVTIRGESVALYLQEESG